MGLALEQLKTQITALSAAVATPASIAAVKAVVDADKVVDDATLPAIGAAITAADHLAPIARTGATAIAGSGTALVAIPAGAKSYSIGSADSTRALPLTGYCAASNSPRTKTGPISTLNDSGPIPAKLDDGATDPTHLFVAETGVVGGTFWIDWYA